MPSKPRTVTLDETTEGTLLVALLELSHKAGEGERAVGALRALGYDLTADLIAGRVAQDALPEGRRT